MWRLTEIEYDTRIIVRALRRDVPNGGKGWGYAIARVADMFDSGEYPRKLVMDDFERARAMASMTSEIEDLRAENARLKALITAVGELCSGPPKKKINWWEDVEGRRAAATACCEILLRDFLVDPAAINSVIGELEAIVKARRDFREKEKGRTS